MLQLTLMIAGQLIGFPTLSSSGEVIAGFLIALLASSCYYLSYRIATKYYYKKGGIECPEQWTGLQVRYFIQHCLLAILAGMVMSLLHLSDPIILIIGVFTLGVLILCGSTTADKRLKSSLFEKLNKCEAENKSPVE